MMRRPMWKMMAAAMVLASVAATTTLFAHAKLEKTEPVANSTVTKQPPHVQLFFNEALDMAVTKLAIKGPSAKVTLVSPHAMDKSIMAMIDGDMADGLYTVTWQTAGDDGHPQKGEFSFTLKRK